MIPRLILLSVVLMLALSFPAFAACPAAPTGSTQDTVIQMKASNGQAGMGPAGALVSTSEGTLVYDSTAGALKLCDGTNWVQVNGTAAGTATMVNGWPDALVCTVTGTASGMMVFYAYYMPHTPNGLYYYQSIYSGNAYIYLIFNPDKSYNSFSSSTGNVTASNCNQSISSLYSSGKAFNFVGSPFPTGAVMAFDLASCPSGWTEYTAARGRFLRGIDNGAGNDPDGTRAPGATQADMLGSHTHDTGIPLDNATGGMRYKAIYGATTAGNQLTAATGGAETRPKNVAVLFCRKN